MNDSQKSRPRRALLAAALLAAAGCGDSTATVTGEVTFNGQPVKSGYVTLSPADGKGPTVGAKITDGRFTAEKVTPGPKVALVEAADKPAASVQSQGDLERMSKEMRGKIGPDGIVRADLIPPGAEGNNQTVEVKSGSQTLKFDLKSAAKK